MNLLPEQVENLQLYYWYGEEILIMEREGKGAYGYPVNGELVYLDKLYGELEDIVYEHLSKDGTKKILYAIENFEKDKMNYLNNKVK